MKVNLHLLRDDLPELHLEGHLEDAPWVARCSHAEAYDSEVEGFRDDTICITRAELLPGHVPTGSGVPSVLCIGRPPEKWLSLAINILYTEEDVGLLELLNMVSADIARYQIWEDELAAAVSRQAPKRELSACVHEMVKNPFFVQGSVYNILLASFPDDADDSLVPEGYREMFEGFSGTVLDSDEINVLIADDDYIHAIEAVGPAIYDGNARERRTLFLNIQAGGVTIGRVGIEELLNPICSRDYVLIEVLGTHFLTILERSHTYGLSTPEDLDPVMQGLLRHELLPEERIAILLDNFGWEMHDEFVCMNLKLRTGSDTDTALEPLAPSMAQLIDDYCYTVFGDSIVFVTDLTKSYRTEDQALAQVLPPMRDNFFMLSLSSSYCDFKDLCYYYQQTEAAYAIGLRREPSRWTFRFEEYELDYFLEKAMEGTIPEVLIPRGLRRLIEHDREKDGDYVGLLRTYLDHDRCIADTIRDAHIHRSTFRYRMEKIEELLDMDLDDPDARQLLQMALRVLDASEERGGGGGDDRMLSSRL